MNLTKLTEPLVSIRYQNKLYVVHVCESFFAKALGLMFRKTPVQPWLFVFAKPVRYRVTMFWVFFSLDVAFLDEKGVIVDVVKGLHPFKNYYPKQAYSYFLETRTNFFPALKVGDTFKLAPKE